MCWQLCWRRRQTRAMPAVLPAGTTQTVSSFESRVRMYSTYSNPSAAITFRPQHPRLLDVRRRGVQGARGTEGACEEGRCATETAYSGPRLAREDAERTSKAAVHGQAIHAAATEEKASSAPCSQAEAPLRLRMEQKEEPYTSSRVERQCRCVEMYQYQYQ